MTSERYIETIHFSDPENIVLNVEKPPRNRRIALTMTPGFPPDAPEAAIERPISGAHGEYEITYVFAIPGESQYFTDFKNLNDKGDSQITLGSVPSILVARYPGNASLQFELFSNSQGNLARATLKIVANNFDHADVLGYELVTPLLSLVSFQCDCGIDICARYLRELSTGSMRCVMLALGQTKAWPFTPEKAIGPFTTEIAPLLALYREAMNSINPFYQFLCFYKITEGIKNLRPLRHKKAKEAGSVIPPFEGERFALSLSEMGIDPDDRPLFLPVLGKTFGFVRDQMRDVLRNAVAHMDVKSNAASSDNLAHMSACEAAIPVIKFMAYRMLYNEMSLTQPSSI